MERLANALTDKLVQWNIVKYEDRELYAYGLWQGTILIFNFLTIIVIGLLFKMLWQSLVFIIAYGFLRPVAGGYHARKQINCYILSIVLIVTVLCMLRWIHWNSIVCLIILLISGIIILLFAPIEDENKPLDIKEKRVYKHRTRIILFLLTLLSLSFLLVGNIQISSNIAISILFSAIMLILGKIKNIVNQAVT